ncbi:MAG: hypothetical protein WCQ47_00125 [bacterium]
MPVHQLIYAFINLLALLAFLFFILRKNVATSLKNRKEDFIKRSQEADEYCNQSFVKLSEAKKKLEDINENGKTYLKSVKDNSELLAQKMIDDAQRIAKMTTTNAEQRGESELKRAKNELKKDFVSNVISETRKTLKTQVNEVAMNSYIDEYSAVFKDKKPVLR